MSNFSSEDYMILSLGLMEEDIEYWVKNEILINATFSNGKIDSFSMNNLFKKGVDFRSIMLNVIHCYSMYLGYHNQFLHNGFTPGSLNPLKKYVLNMRVNANGIDIDAKKGFGVSMFANMNAISKAMEESINSYLLEVIRKSEMYPEWNNLSKVAQYLNDLYVVEDIDEIKYNFIVENISLFFIE